MKTTILTAPQGWGKTRNAKALCKELGCGQRLTTGALHLPNMPPESLRITRTDQVKLVLRGWITQHG